MKRILGTLLAATVIAGVSAPAFAHERDNGGQGSSQYYGGYRSFDELYRHDCMTIQHGLRDGAYSRGEAQQFLSLLRDTRQRESYFRSRDGYLDPREGQDIQRRLERLHAIMHEAHDEGHDAQDNQDNYGRRDGGYDNGRPNDDNGRPYYQPR